jgi:hypothetical protein
MARNTAPAADEVEQLDEVEDIPDAPQSDQEAAGQGQADPSTAAAKAPKNPRWTPPEGYHTLVGFAKVVTARGLHTPRGADQPAEVKSQMVYSYARNAKKDDKFPQVFFNDANEPVASAREDGPGETLTFEEAKARGLHQAVKEDEGVAWWERKNARVTERAQNAAAKTTSKPAEAEVTEVEDGDAAEVVEAE